MTMMSYLSWSFESTKTELQTAYDLGLFSFFLDT
jgi:hypothetical protein